MISSELPEVLGMSDRILVMHEGRIKGEITDVAAAISGRSPVAGLCLTADWGVIHRAETAH